MRHRRFFSLLSLLSLFTLVGLCLVPYSCRRPPGVSPAQQKATRGSVIDLAALRQLTDPEHPQRSEACRRALDQNRSILRRFGFQEPEGLEGWQADMTLWELSNGKLRTSARDQRLRISLEPDFDCLRVQRVTIRMRRHSTAAGGRIVVQWASGPDAPFSRKQSLGVPLRRDDWYNIYSIDVGDHPKWRGYIGALRIEFSNIKSGVTIDTINFEEGLSVEEQLMLRIEGGIDGGMLTIDDETRPAMRMPPGQPCSIPLVLPEIEPAVAGAGAGPALVFGLGVSRKGWLDGGNPVRFRVFIESGATGEPQLLFDQILDPLRVPAHRGWQDHEISLAGHAGELVRLSFSSEELGSGDPAGSGDFAVWAHPRVHLPSAPQPSNVLVVLVDTLRADHMSGYGCPVRNTPHLDRLARRGAAFQEVVSSSNWTATAVASLVTGQHPYRHGVRSHRSLRLGDEAHTLAERFRDNGYVTGAISDNKIIIAGNGYAQGFHSFLNHPGNRLERGAGELTDRALTWLERHGRRPFFLYLHYMDPHGPYIPEAPFHPGRTGRADTIRPFVEQGDCGEVTRRLHRQPGFELSAAEQQHLVALYDGEIAQADFHIARVCAWLNRAGLLDRTIVIFVADHGEGFGEHGVYSHDHTLYDEEVRIPLFVLAPDQLQLSRGVPAPGIVRMVDLAPTICDLAGLAVDDNLAGRSLVPWMKGEATPPAGGDAYSERAPYARPNAELKMISSLRFKDMKLIFDAIKGQYKMFDLAGDPYEQENLFKADDRVAVSLIERLDRYLGEAAGVKSATGQSLDATQLGQLKALGYLDN